MNSSSATYTDTTGTRYT